MKEINVGNNEAGKRFDKLLLKYLDKAPSSFIYKMLRKKNITLNDKKATGAEKLVLGDNIKIYLSDETFNSFSSVREENKVDVSIQKAAKLINNLDIVYEDKDIILMNKPANVLSQKAKYDDVSINEIMLAYLLNKGALKADSLTTFKPSICNRLDRNTSGLIIGGKSLQALQYCSEALQKRTTHKYYLAFVEGHITKKATIKGYLKKDSATNKVAITDHYIEGAEEIETYYEPIALYKDITLLKLLLVTGKPHQLRAHLASIGHGIIGDSKYGKASINKKYEELYSVKHQLLHSFELEFPCTEGYFSYLNNKVFSAMPPKAFRMVLEHSTPIEMKGLDQNANLEFQRIKGKCLRRHDQ